jgi:hypothetical protein
LITDHVTGERLVAEQAIAPAARTMPDARNAA